MEEQKFFRLTPQQAMEKLETQRQGLTGAEAARRLEQYGPNALLEQKRKTVLQVFLEQFKDLLVVILIVAALISMASGNVESTIVIFAVLILNAILGTVQHFKAEKPAGPRRPGGAGGGGPGGRRRPHFGKLLPEGQRELPHW